MFARGAAPQVVNPDLNLRYALELEAQWQVEVALSA